MVSAFPQVIWWHMQVHTLLWLTKCTRRQLHFSVLLDHLFIVLFLMEHTSRDIMYLCNIIFQAFSILCLQCYHFRDLGLDVLLNKVMNPIFMAWATLIVDHYLVYQLHAFCPKHVQTLPRLQIQDQAIGVAQFAEIRRILPTRKLAIGVILQDKIIPLLPQLMQIQLISDSVPRVTRLHRWSMTDYLSKRSSLTPCSKSGKKTLNNGNVTMRIILIGIMSKTTLMTWTS